MLISEKTTWSILFFFGLKMRIHEGDNYKKYQSKIFDAIEMKYVKKLVVSHEPLLLGHLSVKNTK